MPTYVYACSSCHETYEVEQRITENALTTCRCGSEGTIKRVIQPIAVMFKGSGFHINDYTASGEKPSTAKDEEGSTATATDNKPAEASTPGTAHSKDSPAESKAETKLGASAPVAASNPPSTAPGTK